MPDAEAAKVVTGYERGTITPFGSRAALPVLTDARVDTPEIVAIGGGAHGVELLMRGEDLIRHLGADVADVTRPA